MVQTYPPVGFFFEVIFLGKNLDNDKMETRFQSVSGLSVELQTETLKEGGEQRFEHILPVRSKYNPLILKRGLVKDSKMIQWCMDAIENYNIQPMDLLVKLLHLKRSNEKATLQNIEPLITWSVVNAWPKKWSVSDFNAEQGSIAIESLELNYNYFKIKTQP